MLLLLQPLSSRSSSHPGSCTGQCQLDKSGGDLQHSVHKGGSDLGRLDVSGGTVRTT